MNHTAIIVNQKAYLELSQKAKMDRIATLVNSFQWLTIIAKHPVLDVSGNLGDASEITTQLEELKTCHK